MSSLPSSKPTRDSGEKNLRRRRDECKKVRAATAATRKLSESSAHADINPCGGSVDIIIAKSQVKNRIRISIAILAIRIDLEP
jgi:hypothetical protein